MESSRTYRNVIWDRPCDLSPYVGGVG